jgi:hypothetical protein
MRFRSLSLWIGFVVLALRVGAQEIPEGTARELFYKPVPVGPAKHPGNAGQPAGPKQGPAGAPQATAPPPDNHTTQTAPAPRLLGLRYRILKMNAEDEFVSVRPESTFRRGDRIRIQLESNRRGYLYVVCQGSDSAWGILFPSFDITDNNNDIRAFEPVTVPYLQEFIFDRTPGTEHVYVVLSEQLEGDLDNLVKVVRMGASRLDSSQPGLRALIALKNDANPSHTEGKSRNLLVSRPPDSETDLSARNSVYLVNISPEKSRVIAEVPLRHE